MSAISYSFLCQIRWLRRERESGEQTPRRQGKPLGSRLDAHEVIIEGMIEAQKDITLNEMMARLKSERAVGIGRSMLSRWLRQHGWTFKKDRPCTETGARGRPETTAEVVRSPVRSRSAAAGVH